MDKKYAVPGLYFFEVLRDQAELSTNEWGSAFCDLWNHKRLSWASGTKKIRIAKHRDSIEAWLPLYLGKSKNVSRRIFEHVNQPADKPTFSMKMKARENLAGLTFKVGWISLAGLNYELLAPVLESTLRDRLHPIVGKQ